MNNKSVEANLDDCAAELAHLEGLIVGLGPAAAPVPYLTKYSIIKACGTVEQAFKTLIADFCDRRSKPQVKRFVQVKVRDASSNPTYGKMCQYLKDFDVDWHARFTQRLDSDADKTQLLASLESLVGMRNDFAHGGNPSATIGDVVDYFRHSRQILEHMDAVIG